MRGAQTLALALVGAAALPAAAAAAQRTSYSVLEARGSQTLTFEANPQTCASYGVCGESGTVEYAFRGDPTGSLVLRRDGRRQAGTANFRTRGRTRAEMTGPNGSCSHSVARTRERFSLRGGLRRLVFRLHSPREGRDYLRTDCPTPGEAHLARDGALPKGSFAAADFARDRTAFELEGKSVLDDRGYRGTLRWKLSYRIKRR